MEKPVVFISHATSGLPEDARVRQIRDCLYDMLTARGWSPFLDKEILHPSVPWRSAILGNLARAQGGVILFSRRAATESRWVVAEAQILCFRRSLDPQFQIVPVLLEELSLHDTCFGHYEPFQLNEIQALKDDETLPPEAIARRIVENLDPALARRPPVSRWVHRILSLLARVERRTLQLAAGEMGLSLTMTPHSLEDLADHLRASLAELMHAVAPADSLPAFRLLLPELDPPGAQTFSRLLSAKWVSNESAETLLCAGRARQTVGCLTMNPASHAVTQEYLNRIRIEWQDGAVWAFSVAAAAGEGDEIALARIEGAVREGMQIGEDFDDGGDDGFSAPPGLPEIVDARLSRPGNVAFCALPREYARPSLLGRLRATYPKIVFIVQFAGGEANPAEPLGGVRPLLPPLTRELHGTLQELRAELGAAIQATYL